MSTPATAEQPVFETDQGRFSLQRYPRQKNSQLKAWDAADAYLLNTLSEQNLADKKLLIVHDNFGALSLPLLPFSPMVYGDSWMSEQAVRQNLIANGIEAEIDFESSLETLLARDTKPECIVGRVPKNKAQFAYLLSRLREFAAPGCELFLAGMDKHLSRGQYELVEEYFGPSSFMPGVKKARIWRAKVDKTLSTRASYFKRFSLPEFALNIDSAPNVFSRDKLDIGTRFLLEQIAKLPQKARVVDLACGNGVLGLAYLKRYAPESLLFVDESYQAIESVRYNLENNWGQSLDSDP